MTSIGSAVLVADTHDMPRDEWLEHRRAGIGGSDVSAIAGLSKWSTPLQVWLEKTGLYVPDDAPSEAMEWGSLLEPVVADEFSRRSGVPTMACTALLKHGEHEHMLANLDRLTPYDPVEDVREPGVYEGKTTHPYASKEWANNSVPDHALLQTEHYLAVTGLPYAYIAVLIGGQRLEWRRVVRDDDLIGQLVKIETEFWSRVENMDPPAPVEADSQFLGEVWTPAPETVATLDDTLLRALRTRERGKALIKKIEARVAVAEAAVKLALGDREFGAAPDGTVVCSWKQIPAGRVEAHDRAAYRRFVPVKPKKTGAGA